MYDWTGFIVHDDVYLNICVCVRVCVCVCPAPTTMGGHLGLLSYYTIPIIWRVQHVQLKDNTINFSVATKLASKFTPKVDDSNYPKIAGL